ncbi:hypothetical protein [Streptomyces sp. NPDC047315]|uniref:hypothetical protein n=1 Tax=Streptomyces sp. NPDC047315 TaxID=3155142 RepID=UPI0033D1222F
MLLRAISADAILLEATTIAGPALAVALGSGHSAAPTAGMAAAFVISSLVLPRAVSGPAAVAEEPGADAAPIAWLRTVGWLGCLFTIGHLLSTLEVGALPLAERAGAGQGAAALLIGVLSVASIVGSTLFAWRGGAGTTWAVLFLSGLAVGGGLTALDAGRPALIGGLVLVGHCTGPLLAVGSVNLQRVLPRSRRAEGFSVAHVVQTVGFASGSLSLGVLDLETAIAPGRGQRGSFRRARAEHQEASGGGTGRRDFPASGSAGRKVPRVTVPGALTRIRVRSARPASGESGVPDRRRPGR